MNTLGLRYLIIAFILCSFSYVHADGTRYWHKDTNSQQEFENVYQDINGNSAQIGSYLGHILDVKTSYGAKGDGITDDASAIQKALSDAATTYAGALVYFPSGTYLIGKGLIVYSSTTLMGCTLGAARIKAKNSLNDRLLQNQARLGTGTDLNINFSNLVFDMNGANQAVSTAITIQKVYGHVVQNCVFKNPLDSTYLLTGSNNPDFSVDNLNCLYDNVWFYGTGQSQATDVVDIGNANHVTMRHIYAFDAKTGSGQAMLSIADINDLIIEDSYLDGNKNGVPLSIFGINGGGIFHTEILNSTEGGFRLQEFNEGVPHKYMENFTIDSVNVHDNTLYGFWLRQDFSSTDTVRNITVCNSSFWNNQKNAWKIEIGNNLYFHHNRIYGNSLLSSGIYAAANFSNAGSSAAGLTNVQSDFNIFFDTKTVPTQTTIFNLDWVTNPRLFKNQYTQNTTTYTITANATNVNLQDGDIRYWTGSFTRNMATASGSQSITGVPFKPSSIEFHAVVGSTNTFGWGFADASGNSDTMVQTSAGKGDTFSSACVAIEIDGSNYYSAALASNDLAGFTLNWTKTGSPTGTMTVFYKANQ